jgi:integrase
MRTKFIPPETVALIASGMPEHTRKIWLLMNDTGLRVSDAVKLKYNDIDKEGKIHYKSSKTGKNGIIAVSGNVLALLGRRKSNEFVFKSSKSPKKHIHRATVFKHIKRACKLCGIDPEGIATHTARKNFAVKDFRENGLGKTMYDLQHSNAATTLFYALSDDPIPQVFAKLKIIDQSLNMHYEKIEELFEICDRIFERIENFDEPLRVRIADQKKAGE